jgi:HEAT repeat protein
MSADGKKTAAELLAELARDEDYQKRKQARDAALCTTAQEYSRAEAPVVEALRAAGIEVSSIWDLVNTPARDAKIVPILVAHLAQPYPERVREGIARALAIPEAIAAWDQLCQAYLSETDTGTMGVKWAIHLALAAAADESVLEDLIELAKDRRHGRNRAMFVDALSRIRDPRASVALDQLEDDPDIAVDVRRVRKPLSD